MAGFTDIRKPRPKRSASEALSRSSRGAFSIVLGPGKPGGERGLALVVVMGTAAIAAVMAAHVMLISETVARESLVAAERNRLRYASESAADRAFWMHLVDRRLFATRTLGTRNLQRDEYPGPPWMLDGKAHYMERYGSVVALHDAERGIDFSGADPGKELRDQIDPEDPDRKDLIDTFLAVAADYVDPNDQYRPPGGMERADYEMEGYPTLPRNGPMEFREEVYWLPGWRDVLYGQVRIIPPEGVGFPNQQRGRDKPPFFSSSPSLIRERLNLTEMEVEQIVEARDLWRSEGFPLEENLNPDLMAKIRAQFSMVESGVVTVEVQAASRGGDIGRRMTMTRLADVNRPEATIDGKEAWALWYRQYR